MDLGIRGRVALVTGASKGLGLGLATALPETGSTLLADGGASRSV